MRDINWRQQAACRGSDPRLFDSLEHHELRVRGAHALSHPRIQRAVDICSRCPVATECDAAAEAEKAVGVRGGRYRRLPTTPASSAKQRRARKKAAA
jgi:hypothetical protein